MDYGFVHAKSGNILEINDGVRPKRSQLFTYDGLYFSTSNLHDRSGNLLNSYKKFEEFKNII